VKKLKPPAPSGGGTEAMPAGGGSGRGRGSGSKRDVFFGFFMGAGGVGWMTFRITAGASAWR